MKRFISILLCALLAAACLPAAALEAPADCPHTDVIEEVTLEATCLTPGKKTVKCNLCLETWEEVIPAGHEYELSGLMPTCTEEGEVTYTCLRCGDTFTAKEPALGHDYAQETVEPTCTENGHATYTCRRCGDTFTELLASPGHDYVTEKTPATWRAAGEEVRTCARCGDVQREVLPQLTHLAADDCPTGDADMDGKVTSADARYILRLAVKFDDGLDDEQLKRADFDADGTVNAADARCALRVAVKLDPFGKTPVNEDPAPEPPETPENPDVPELDDGYTFKGYTSKGYVLAEKGGVTYIKTAYGYTLLVNKTYALPSTYTPYKFSGSEPDPTNVMGLTPECRAAFAEMQAGAKKDDVTLTLVSGYRSYSRQSNIYNKYAKKSGYAAADTYSARPGHSEHQTGLAMDLNSLSRDFAITKEGKWLAANAYKYGFIIRFPDGKQSKTGYTYEPWHVRYLGKSLAADVYKSGLCLEEYFGVTSVYQ